MKLRQRKCKIEISLTLITFYNMKHQKRYLRISHNTQLILYAIWEQFVYDYISNIAFLKNNWLNHVKIMFSNISLYFSFPHEGKCEVLCITCWLSMWKRVFEDSSHYQQYSALCPPSSPSSVTNWISFFCVCIQSLWLLRVLTYIWLLLNISLQFCVIWPLWSGQVG